MNRNSVRQVAFVSNSARDEYSGRLRWVGPLRERGFGVSFVLPEGDEEYARRIRDRGIKVFEYSMSQRTELQLGDARAIRDLVRLFRAERFDILHSFGHKANFCMGLAAMYVRAPHAFLHVTGLGSPFAPGGGARRMMQRAFLRGYYRIASRKLSGVFFQNQDDPLDLRLGAGARTVLSGSTGVDLDYFNPASVSQESVAELRHELGLEGRLIVTYVGRLLQDKGVPELVTAARELHRRDPRIVLLIVGTPDPGNPNNVDTGTISTSTDGFVRFLGRRDDIREILALTDVFVNPSSYREGVPRSNLEALAMGKPVVTTNGPGCRDTVLDGETGLLVPKRDPRALESALRQLLESNSLSARFGRAARIDAQRRFSTEVAVDRVASAYVAAMSRTT